MQIQLKQPEIEAALRNYVSHQGISLVGKDVTIDFTSGRKNNGITADIQIENGSVTTDVSVPEPVPPVPEGVAEESVTEVRAASLFK